MSFRLPKVRGVASSTQRMLKYAFHDWTREMPKSKRFVAFAAVFLQGYAFYALFTGSLIWPWIWPKQPMLYACVWLLYMVGYCTLNAMLTSEFVRKTQLESDVIAARQIQQTLQPVICPRFPGYDIETFYKPFREVGGDYFDIIQLPANRILIALADVSGKGMPAALLAANIQALVRSISLVATDPLIFAVRINNHLNRYTPGDRFATALFIVISRDSGEITYVNAGHNAPILSSSSSTGLLKATGIPLGLFEAAKFNVDTAFLTTGGSLLIFTDGFTDSIPGTEPEERLRGVLAEGSRGTMDSLKSLIDRKFNEDDVTILLIKRTGHAASG